MTTPNSQRSIADSLRVAQEPIAIIGLGCRLPGGSDDWRSYWRMLESGTDAIMETPADRWNLQKFYVPGKSLPGKTQSKWGGYVTNIDQFDAPLFGISPREAASMDPQQRMLLDSAFRALEDAGQPLEKIAGQSVSVFVGISSFDYAVAGLSYQDRGVIDAYSNTGGSSSIAANRISYCFDLRGPSVAVDTACSSSLVAVHMACESIWRGEAAMALAGGVNALILPDFYVAFSQLGVMSPDGRCKTFDSRANGYVRSEGAAVVMLKPLSAALRDKDPIYAVIRATALNQDGRTPGMTVPSQEAQASLIRAACEKASVAPRDVQYVEAHGTGTPVGDPIEANAIGSVIGQGRTGDDRCWVGSVKTNIGHLEAGAGMASLLKVALALHHQKIPQNLHFEHANPAINLDQLGLRVPTQTLAWQSSTSRLAGINGFGYGGANAHVIIEQAPQSAAQIYSTTPSRKASSSSNTSTDSSSQSTQTVPVLLPLSARNLTALQQSAQQMADWLAGPGSNFHLAETAGFCAHRRSHFDLRATVCASDHAAMIDQLQTLAKSSVAEMNHDISAAQREKGLAFVCSGQGPQWWAMGRGLLKYSPAFRSMIKRCDAEFSKYGNWSLVEELERPEAQSRMQQTSIAQPSIFAIQVSLAALWESWGIKPTAIVGHSVGEIAAAYLSGALNWEDACCVAFHRGRTMDLATSQGAMVAAGLSPGQVPEWIRGLEDQVAVAAINGPSSVTISGAAVAIESIAQRLEAANIFCRRLAVEYAFHSPQMDPVRDELLRSLAGIRPQATHTTLVSTVTGKVIDGSELGAEYWWHNVRESVRFADAMYQLADMGYAVAVEIGPHPVLAYSINECFQVKGATVRSVPSLNRQQSDLLCISKSLGTLYSLGFDINWSGFYNQPARKLSTPTYPFQCQRLWNESLESQLTRRVEISHPLLGEAADEVQPTWQQRIDLKIHDYLADHRVRGSIVYPAAAMLETAIAAAWEIGKEKGEPKQIRLERLRLHNPCLLSDDQPQWIESRWNRDRRQLSLASRNCRVSSSGDSRWNPLATVTLSTQPIEAVDAKSQFARIQSARQRCNRAFTQQQLYDYCSKLGLQYGPAFQGITGGVQRGGEAVAEVTLPASVDCSGYQLHPALLDSCFHAMIAADHSFDTALDGLYLPAEIREVVVYAPANATSLKQLPSKLVVHARVLRKTPKKMWCDLDITTVEGALVVTIRGFESQRVVSPSTVETTEDLIYSYRWQAQPIADQETSLTDSAQPASLASVDSPSTATASWLLFMDEGRTGRELAQRLRGRGDKVVEIYRSHSQIPQTSVQPFYQIDPENRDEFERLFRKVTATPVSGVVYLWGLDATAVNQLQCESLRQSTVLTTLAPLNLVQAWENATEAINASLAIVTSGAQTTDDDATPCEVAQGPLIGLGRVIVSEYGRLRAKLVDLPPTIAARDLDNLVAELIAEDNEDEVMWRGDNRFAQRFLPQLDKPLSQKATVQSPVQLRLGRSSGVEELRYETKARGQLVAGQVEIEVVAAGLNFSDVMKALDLYPGLTDAVVELGAECSGRISRVGPNSRWAVGDEVIAIAPGAFGSHVTVNELLVARKPNNLSHEEAAAVPVAFLTAYYALLECARLRKGDSVLIHAASGGVGLAAIQLAQAEGVRILATAGTSEKREYVRRLGVDTVMDSRTLAFGAQTLDATAGHGVDAVLNSLPGEAINTGLSVLKTGGRFLEIGKRDIYNDAALGLYPFRNNLALFAIDLDQLFKQQAARMGVMLEELVERFESGELRPLPVEVFSAADTNEAFKLMQQGKHIGKVVVQYRQRPRSIVAGSYDPLQFKSNATYWVAGGLGGFGLEITKWMVQCGARHLVLSGRSQQLRPAAAEAIAQMQAAGASIKIVPCDITQPTAVRSVLETIDAEMPPLAGVVHTAMVLEDKLLVDLDRATLERVLWPKVLGGWNLHQQTLDRQLDLFVVFSSLSSVFGHAGQANYSAANALLDSLAHYRRNQGLPGLVINWGHLGEVGYLAEREQLGERLERQGVLSFTVKQATSCLEYAIQTMAVQMSVLRMDWSIWRGLGITNRVSPKFAHLLRNTDGVATAGTEMASVEGLRAAVGPQRLRMVSSLLRSKIGSLLGMPAEQVREERALLEMGLDSLMAVELRNWIEGHMEVNLPISALMKSQSLGGLIAQISDGISQNGSSVGSTSSDSTTGEKVLQPASATTSESNSGNATNSASPTQWTSEQAGQLLNNIDQLTDDQVSQLLSQVLKQM